jgi:phage terminase large subunit
LRKEKPNNAIVVEANWRDNPWFPSVLEDERQLELAKYPERYGHTWEGEYAAAFEGAYFAGCLNQAKLDGRICKVSADPLLPIQAWIDIGGAGAKADAFTMWIAQFVGQEIRVLDYYEAQGQVLAEHLHWLRRGYQRATIRLPHDGVNVNNITGKQYKDHFAEAEFNVPPPTPNQGSGAASMRIEAVRGYSRRSGSTKPRRSTAGWLWASTTRKRTNCATWAWGLTMIGRPMLRTHLA